MQRDSIVFISKKLRDFNLLLFGLVVMTIGFLALMSDKLSKTRFVFGSAIVWTIGFPLAQTLVVSMFSKKIRSRKQVRRTMISFWCIAKELTLPKLGCNDGMDRCYWFFGKNCWTYYCWIYFSARKFLHFFVFSWMCGCFSNFNCVI